MKRKLKIFIKKIPLLNKICRKFWHFFKKIKGNERFNQLENSINDLKSEVERLRLAIQIEKNDDVFSHSNNFESIIDNYKKNESLQLIFDKIKNVLVNKKEDVKYVVLDFWHSQTQESKIFNIEKFDVYCVEHPIDYVIEAHSNSADLVIIFNYPAQFKNLNVLTFLKNVHRILLDGGILLIESTFFVDFNITESLLLDVGFSEIEKIEIHNDSKVLFAFK